MEVEAENFEIFGNWLDFPDFTKTFLPKMKAVLEPH